MILRCCFRGPKSSDYEPIDDQMDEAYEKVERLFSRNKLLAKMLITVVDPRPDLKFYRMEQEFSELKVMKKVLTSSTTLIVSGCSAQYYRDIGFLIDADKCNIRLISKIVTHTGRKYQNESVEWSIEKESYVKFHTKEIVDYQGAMDISDERGLVNTTQELINHSRQQSENNKNRLCINEVVVDYTFDSIVGLFVAINRKGDVCGYVSPTTQQVNETFQHFKATCLGYLGIAPPCFILDCQDGSLKKF